MCFRAKLLYNTILLTRSVSKSEVQQFFKLKNFFFKPVLFLFFADSMMGDVGCDSGSGGCHKRISFE